MTGMDLGMTERLKPIHERVSRMVRDEIMPLEGEFLAEVGKAGDRFAFTERQTEILEGLKGKARERGLWNFWLTGSESGFGLTTVEYAYLAEEMGKAHLGAETFNCSAPDTGNMEVLERYGSEDHKKRWLEPLLDGRIRSAYLMTEPQVASSDATNVECSITREGDEYVLNGRKWWSSNIYHPHCELLLVMGKTRFDGPRHTQQSTIIVPRNTPGIKVLRPLKVFGEVHSPSGHGEVVLENVRVPVSNIVLGEGRGFEIAQGRLGPGRIHHCMRLVGAAQRALEWMCRRVETRVAFGKKLSEQSSIRQDIARSRCQIEQARLLTLAAADKMDREGNKGAADLISMIKIVAPQMCQDVCDRAMQAHGAMGLCQDTPIASSFAYGRFVRFADGPDEVHMSQLAKWTIAKVQALETAP